MATKKAMSQKWEDLDERSKLKYISSEDLSRSEIFYKSVGLKPLNQNDMQSAIHHIFFAIFEGLMYGIRNEFVTQSLILLESWERKQWEKEVTLAKDITFPFLKGGSIKKTAKTKKIDPLAIIPTEVDKLEYSKELMKNEGGLIEAACVKLGFDDFFDQAIHSLVSLNSKEQCALADFKIQKFINTNKNNKKNTNNSNNNNTNSKLQKKQINFLPTDDPLNVEEYHLDCFIFSKNHILEILQDNNNPLSIYSLWKSIPQKVFEGLKTLKAETSSDYFYFKSDDFEKDFKTRIAFPTPNTGPQVANLIHWMVQNLVLQILGLSNRMGLQFANRTKKRRVSEINANDKMTLEDGRQIPNTITVGTVLAITETNLRTRFKQNYNIILKEEKDNLIFLPISIVSKTIPFFEKGRIKSQFEDLNESDFIKSIPTNAPKTIVTKYKELVSALPYFLSQNMIFDLKVLKSYKKDIKKTEYLSPKYNELRSQSNWKDSFTSPLPLKLSSAQSKYWVWGYYDPNLGSENGSNFKRPIVFLMSQDQNDDIYNQWLSPSEISKYYSTIIASLNK